MSEFKKYPSEYKDLDCLKAALVEHGCDEIEVHATPTALNARAGTKSYWGANTKVDVSARHNHKVFGFVKSETGTYDAMIEEDGYTRSSEKNSTSRWMTDLKRRYNEQVTAKEAKKQRLTPYTAKKEIIVNGRKVTRVQYLQA